jgi:hypothetical protein
MRTTTFEKSISMASLGLSVGFVSSNSSPDAYFLDSDDHLRGKTQFRFARRVHSAKHNSDSASGG